MSMMLEQLAARVGAVLEGDGSIEVHRCAPIESAGPDAVTFVANQKYAKHLATTRAAAVFVDPSMSCPPTTARLVTDDPYFAFRNALIELHGFREHPAPMESRGGISPRAAIHEAANVGQGTLVHPHVTIERGAVIGTGCVLYPGVYVGQDARVGDDCLLYPNAVVYDRCVLGDRVTLHSCVVVGHDGFGYASHGGEHHKIPQTGIAVIEDDVELGAGCAIERATMGETRIGKGTKFADLISIGHGATVGQHCLAVSLAGVAGSAELGDYVVLAGQSGVVGHVEVGSRVKVAARALVTEDTPPGTDVGGNPAVDHGTSLRNAVTGKSLAELAKRVRRLERKNERDES